MDMITRGIDSAKRNITGNRKRMSQNEALHKSLALADSCEVAMVGSNSKTGHPNIKAMFKIKADGIKTIWFSTNSSSTRVAQFNSDLKACVYFYDPGSFQGLMLTGTMDVLSDLPSKQFLWVDGWEVYYPLGVTDPDYSVLRFHAQSANYYHGLQNVTFEIN